MNTIGNHSQLLDALSGIDSAIAIVSSEQRCVKWSTNGFQSLVPLATSQASLADAFKSEPELLAAITNVLSMESATGVNEIHIDNTSRQVELQVIENQDVLVSVRPLQSITQNLHEYMHARDSLFSTSRTISVSEMATTLAHELNTPIGTISNILRGLKIRLAKPDTPKETLDNAISQALEQTKFTQNIINRIRDFTQSRRPKHQVIDLRDQLTDAVSLLDWMLSHNGCRVSVQVPDTPVLIMGDATMLQQVLINLIRNAVDAMENQQPSRRHISVQVSSNSEQATVSIRDTGQGLGDGADQLFVPFATSKANGMGVGLNICRSFVELHQGRLWLSPNDDEGCTSFVELPVVVEESIAEGAFV